MCSNILQSMQRIHNWKDCSMGRVQNLKSTQKASATREKTFGADLSQDHRLHLLSGHRSDEPPYAVHMLDSLAVFF